MKYNVGDRVRIKSLDWYNKNKDNYGAIYAGNGFCFWKNMVRHCGEIMKITIVKVDPEDSNKGYYFMENSKKRWTDEMIEGLVEEEDDLIPKFGEYSDNEPLDVPTMTTDFVKEYGLPCPNGYIFKEENGNVINARKIVLEKKKKEYPKTYKECCKILGILNVDLCFNADYRSFDASKEQWKRLGLMNQFYQLLICRDAYWKIAGEEMGLGKPWEPDWDDDEWPDMYYISWSGKYLDKEKGYPCCNMILIFPTEEMRDAFKENFDTDIESCKELL